MKRRSLLKETMVLARTGDIKGFESFYILTVFFFFKKVLHISVSPKNLGKPSGKAYTC